MAAAFPSPPDRDTGNSPSRCRYLPQAPPRKSWDELEMAVVVPRVNTELNEAFILALARQAASMPRTRGNNIARARVLRDLGTRQQAMDDAQVDSENADNLASRFTSLGRPSPQFNSLGRPSPPSYDSDSGPDVESDNSADQESDDRPLRPSFSTDYVYTPPWRPGDIDWDQFRSPEARRTHNTNS